MNMWISRRGLGVVCVIIGGIVLTVWNLGTRIDLSDLSATFVNPPFIIGIIFLFAGFFMIKSRICPHSFWIGYGVV